MIANPVDTHPAEGGPSPEEAAATVPAADAVLSTAAPAAEPASPARKRRAAGKAASPAAEVAKPASRKATTARKDAAAPAAKAATRPKKVAAPVLPRALPDLVRPEVDCDVVRDSFTMPQAEYALIAALKARTLQGGRHAKKSELLRAGLQLLSQLDDAALSKTLDALPPIKVGRPKKSR